MRRRLPVLLALLGLLLLSGCFKMDADFTVNSDETVDGTMIVAMDQEFMAAMKEMGAETGETDDLITNPEDLPEGAEVEDYEEDGYVGQKVTFEGVTLDEMMSSMESEGAEATDEWSITHEGSEYVFEGSMDLTFGEGEEMMAGMMEDAEIEISMTFPGDVTESNGEVDGNTVTWEPEIGEKNEMNAVASDESGFPWALVISLVIGLSLVAGIAVFLLLRRRGGTSGTTATAPVQPGQPGAPVDPAAAATPGASPAAPAAPAAPPSAASPAAPPAAEPGQPGATPEDRDPRT